MRISDWSADVCSSDLAEPDQRRDDLLLIDFRMQPIPVFDLQAIDEQVDDLHLETHASALGQPCFAIGRLHQSFQTFAKAVITEVFQRQRCTSALPPIKTPDPVASTQPPTAAR